MKQKLLYTWLVVSLLALHFFWWHHGSQQQQSIALRQTSFEQLPGWNTTQVKKSLLAFQVSCKVFLRQDAERHVGSQRIILQVKDWQPTCKAAQAMNAFTEKDARTFFQKWFTPIEFHNGKPVRGLFTGYYMPLLHGSLTKTKEFNIPIYGMPSNMVTIDLGHFDPKFKNRRFTGRLEGKRLLPYYTRKEINNGAIAQKAEVIVWINSPVDRLFLEIQGSGTVELPDGKRIYLGYAGENGATYTPIARVLINKGIMTKDNASMQRIKSYLESHPNKMNAILNQNKSFVFFRKLKNDFALGAQGVALTPGYSLAIDRKWIPLGTPIWLSTTRPDKYHDDKKPFRRLMIAQDTGGAIRGVVRGDVYWGAGDKATFIAGHMKNSGHYWLLVPKHTFERLINDF